MLKKKIELNQSPLASLLSAFRFEMCGNKEVIIEGCQGILIYDENLIKIKVKKMLVSFFGRNLSVKCLTSDSLIILGFITSVEFTT